MYDIGLVLEGGGMRGIYTAGVLDFFMTKEIFFPYVVGVSAGAINAASYISKQRERSKTIYIKYIKNPKYLSFRNLIKEKSIFGIKFVYDEIPNRLEPFDYNTFNKSEQKFVIGTTNCITGEPHYIDKNKCEDILKVMRASSSLPLLAPIVEIDGTPLLDGGIADSIPIRKAITDGNKRNIVVLTRDKYYRKTPSKFYGIIKNKYKAYPKLIEALLNRYKVYNDTLEHLEELESKGEVFIVRPTADLKVGRLERNKFKLEGLYNLGFDDAKNTYNSFLSWVKG